MALRNHPKKKHLAEFKIKANNFRDWFGMTRFLLFFMSIAQSLLIYSLFSSLIESNVFYIFPIVIAYLSVILMFRMEYGEFLLSIDLLRKEQRKLLQESIRKESERKKKVREKARQRLKAKRKEVEI